LKPLHFKWLSAVLRVLNMLLSVSDCFAMMIHVIHLAYKCVTF